MHQRITLKLTLGDLKLTAGRSNQIRSVVATGLVKDQGVVKEAYLAAIEEQLKELPGVVELVATRNLKLIEELQGESSS